MLRAIVSWGWCPILITALAVIGFSYGWDIQLAAPLLGVVLVIGLVVAAVNAKERQLSLLALRLKQLADYFNHRFMGSSSLSIFAIIDTLFNVDNPQLWDWARSCDMAKRVFNTWSESFVARFDSGTRVGKYDTYLRAYLKELWLINNHYFEFAQQLYEVTSKVEVPPETVDQYERFVMEYNTFAYNFRDIIAELKEAVHTEIEPPSVKLANELSGVKPSPGLSRDASPGR